MQVIDDTVGHTLAAANTLMADIKNACTAEDGKESTANKARTAFPPGQQQTQQFRMHGCPALKLCLILHCTGGCQACGQEDR